MLLGTWPAIDDGFYYDVLFSDWVEFGEDDLKDLQKTIEGIVKERQSFGRYEARNKQDALELCDLIWQDFKKELIEKFYQANEDAVYTFYYNFVDIKTFPRLEKCCKSDYIDLYKTLTDKLKITQADLDGQFITFLDLCEWWHVPNLSEIADGSFKLDKIAGAYWQGKEDNPMMTRIYGFAFETKEELRSHLEMIEEAKKRDHRVIWQKMKLFAFDEEVWPWLPLRLPNGSIIVEELEKLAKEKEYEQWYLRVRSPHITKESLYTRSWHLPYYAEDMFPPMEMDGEKYYLKPMNCPHHHKIFAATPKSYRDLPARYAEYGHCYRYEDSWSLMWLMRVRSLCMNDAHIYCTEGQFEEEFMKVIELYLYYFKLFGVEKYLIRLSKHGKEWLGKKYVDNEPLRIKTEKQVRDVLVKSGVPFVEAEDEAAFYWPKIDVQIWSVIWREFTLATNQLDFAVPARFDLKYKDKDWVDKIPLCIHRAPLSTHERFIWFLIEHFAWDFPFWLAPEQVRIVPVVAGKFDAYIDLVQDKLTKATIRSTIDCSDDSFSKKIRNAELDKVYYTLILWEKEKDDQTLSVRNIRTKEQFEIWVDEFVSKLIVQYNTRSLT